MTAKKTPVKKTSAKAAVKKTPVKKSPVKKTPAKAERSPQAKTKKSAPGAKSRSQDVVPDLFQILRNALQDTNSINERLRAATPGNADLTPQQRRRLFGVQARKLGFIVKAMDIANARPQFVPPNLSMQNMTTLQRNLEEARLLLATIDQLRRTTDDYLLTGNNALYRGALDIYGMLRAMARLRVPGAQDLFNILRRFFRTGPRSGEGEPTNRELEHEFNSILHGRADGELLIKNETPHMVGGGREVVENVSKRGKRAAEIKVKEEE